MPAISAALLLQYAAACHTPVAVPDERIIATARVESGFNASAIHDNSSGRSYAPASVGEAVSLARLLLSQGHSLDAGVMQVNTSNWSRLGLSVDDVFEPARNVCAGKRVLAEATERAVSCIYNTGRPNCTNSYPARIEAARFRMPPSEQVVAAGAPAPPAVSVKATEPPSGRAASWNVYASARGALMRVSEK